MIATTVADFIAVAALIAFAVVVWWPAALLVVAAAALRFSWERRE